MTIRDGLLTLTGKIDLDRIMGIMACIHELDRNGVYTCNMYKNDHFDLKLGGEMSGNGLCSRFTLES